MKYKYYEIYYNKPTGAYGNIRELVAVVENKLVAQDFCARRNSPILEFMDSEHYNYVEKEFDFEPCISTEKIQSCAGEVPDPSNIWYNDITEDNIKEKTKLAINSIHKLQKNTSGWSAELKIIEQVLEHYEAKENEIDILNAQIGALGNLLYNCDFEYFLTDKDGNYEGYKWNGMMNYVNNEITRKRFELLKDLLEVRSYK